MTRALKCGNCLSWFVPAKAAPGDAAVARNVPVADDGQRDGFSEVTMPDLCGLCRKRMLSTEVVLSDTEIDAYFDAAAKTIREVESMCDTPICRTRKP